MRSGAILLVLALGVPGASLASPKQFNKLVKQAERLYEAGKYKRSAETLIEAYAYKPHPRLIYNIARAYDQAGELQLALEYYQRYVSSQEGTDPTLLKRSALSIDRLRKLVEKRSDDAEAQQRLAAEAKAAQERAAAEEEAKRRAEEALREREQASAEARAAARSRNRLLSFGFGGLAVAGFATAGVAGLAANSSKAEFTAAQTVERKQVLRDQTVTRAAIADVGLLVGAAAAVTAVLLYPRGGEEAPRALLVPAPGGAGLVVSF